MSSNVQSVVCCLGDPVAGNPTQFLMQRAAAAENLDWMFVTAEVPSERLADAFNGIRALRFSGVAFLKPHQKDASELVDSLTEAAMRSGHVRIARRDGDAWLGDDTLGIAIIELLRTSGLVYLSEVNDALDPSITLVAGEEWLTHLIRLANPASQSSLFHLQKEKPTDNSMGSKTEGIDEQDAISAIAVETAETANLEPVSANGYDNTSSSESQGRVSDFAKIKTMYLDDLIENGTPVKALIVDSSAPGISSKQAASIRFAENAFILLLESDTHWEKVLQSHPQASSFRYLRSIDIAASNAVVNFQFWTGQSIDVAYIRDSLDEYCQW